MNDFVRDDQWQRKKRDEILTGFYGKYALEGRYVFINKSECSLLMQKRLAVDTVLQGKNGSVCIEEKIVRWKGSPLAAFFLETESCTKPGYESPGWMEYGKADYLLYCFETSLGDLDCYLIEFAPLQAWFSEHGRRYHRHVMPDTLNMTAGRLVPTITVSAKAKTVRFLAAPDGCLLWQDALSPRAEGAA